jgi:restriction endonuclease Mrr
LKNPEQGKEAALAQLKAVAELLDRKAASDAEEFKRWLLSVAQRVAEAANEGGFFGFGGERVSEAEKQTINQIAFNLGLART